jgi:hypothetical protein
MLDDHPLNKTPCSGCREWTRLNGSPMGLCHSDRVKAYWNRQRRLGLIQSPYPSGCFQTHQSFYCQFVQEPIVLEPEAKPVTIQAPSFKPSVF